MAKQWEAKCKTCGNKLSYSDRSYTNSLKYGFSRPEYCEVCQPEHKKQKGKMAAPYFNISVNGQQITSTLGKIQRPTRVHLSSETQSKFDKDKFGVTEADIYKIAAWFRDPNHRVLVATGATGAGKTIAVPYWFLYPPENIVRDFGEDYFTKDGQILLTEPRKIALRKAISFLGELMGSSIGKGQDLGMSMRGEDKTDWRNAIAFATDGKLVNWIVEGAISQYGFIVIDEAHEGSENIKTILRLLNDRIGLYPNLKVVILSATIDTREFKKYFFRHGSTIVNFAGKTRKDKRGRVIKPPMRHFADEKERLPYEKPDAELGRLILEKAEEKAKWLIMEIVSKKREWGDILIFLHGIRPIEELVENLRSWAKYDPLVAQIAKFYPVYRTEDDEIDLTEETEKQPRDGELRIFVSTNIAEASVTIDSLGYEIETGVQIEPNYKSEIGANVYPMVLIAKANAVQRFGRVGRTQNGHVFTLYTKQQFDKLFKAQPRDVLQRTNLQNIIMNVKAAGVPNPQEGWLGNPPKKEVDRATKELIESSMLDSKGSLTSYGSLVRGFSYPPRLIDILMMSDDQGCSVEMATILPVIKNGGYRKLFIWNPQWLPYTKRLAFYRQKALIAGSMDDVDFILKMYKAWSELPWLDQEIISKLKDSEINSLRKQWCQINFVNHATMILIRNERDGDNNATLGKLNVSKKDSKYRTIELSLSGRVRAILRSTLKQGEIFEAPKPYYFSTNHDPNKGTLIYCNLSSNYTQRASVDSWTSRSTDKMDVDFGTRLFIDQVYPIDYCLDLNEYTRDDNWVYSNPVSLYTSPLPVLAVQKSTNDQDTLEENTVLDSEALADKSESTSSLSILDIPINFSYARANFATPKGQFYQSLVKVNGYSIQENGCFVLTKSVENDPFDLFISLYKVGDNIQVTVDELLEFGENTDAILVVHELKTGLEICIEPKDFSFGFDSISITGYRANTRMALHIEAIDRKNRQIRLTNWEAHEVTRSRVLTTHESAAETSVVSAKVIRHTKKGGIVLLIADGLTCVVGGSKLPKNAKDFAIGEIVMVKVGIRTKDTHTTPLRRLSPKAQSEIPQREKPDELCWVDGNLKYKGLIDYWQFRLLQAIDPNDAAFQNALEQLYWRMNQLKVINFVDVKLATKIERNFPVGKTINNARVVSVNDGGVVFEIEKGVQGFAPRSKILNDRGDLIGQIKAGQTLPVRIFEQRSNNGQPIVEITGGLKDPLAKFAIDKLYQCTVIEINQFGIVVALDSQVLGIVRHNEIYRGRKAKTEDLFKPKQKINAKVIAINPHNNESIEMSLKTSEYDPQLKLRKGMTIVGEVVSEQSYGFFVEIGPGVDGRLKHSEIPDISTGFFGSGEKKKPKILIGSKVKVSIISVKPDERKAGRNLYDLKFVQLME